MLSQDKPVASDQLRNYDHALQHWRPVLLKYNRLSAFNEIIVLNSHFFLNLRLYVMSTGINYMLMVIFWMESNFKLNRSFSQSDCSSWIKSNIAWFNTAGDCVQVIWHRERKTTLRSIIYANLVSTRLKANAVQPWTDRGFQKKWVGCYSAYISL